MLKCFVVIYFGAKCGNGAQAQRVHLHKCACLPQKTKKKDEIMKKETTLIVKNGEEKSHNKLKMDNERQTRMGHKNSNQNI